MAAVALVVDDSMVIRHTISRFLEDHGFAVESASNGVEALEFALTVRAFHRNGDAAFVERPWQAIESIR